MGHSSLEIPAHAPFIHSLPNGLQVLLKEDNQAPVVSLQVWVRTGSIHEDKWLGAGLSHLLEHMLFNGTTRRQGHEISAEVQAAGGYINAYTSFDRTVYWIDTPPDGVETCLDVLGDMVFHSVLKEEDFLKELDVIRREMAMGDDSPGQVVGKMMFSAAFQAHPCRYPVIGFRSVFDQLTHADLLAYYKKHYVPNNAFVVVAGPMKPAKMLKTIEKHFGKKDRGPLSPILIPAEPRQQGQRVHHQEGSTQMSQSRMVWQTQPLTHRHTGALDLLATILGSGRSSRLYKRLRDELGLVHSVGAYLYAMSDTGMFIISSETDPDKRAAAEEESLRVVREVIENGVTPQELEKAVKLSLSEALSSLTTTRGIASDIGSSWMLTGNPEFTRDYIRSIQAVTLEDLQAVAKRYLNEANATLVSLNPKGSLKTKTKKRATEAAGDTKRVELPNGLTLLLHADKRLPLVNVTAAMRGGLLAESEKTNGITRYFSRLLTRDTRVRTSAEVADYIESIGGEFSSFSGMNSFALNSEVMAPDWRAGLEVVAQALTQPRFVRETLERERDVQLAAIKSELDRPMTLASNVMREALFPGHAYRYSLIGTEESVANIGEAQLEAFLKDNVLAKNLVVAIYGDIDAAQVEDEVARLTQSLPAGERRFTGAAGVAPLKKAVRLEDFHEKEQAIVLAAYPMEGIYGKDALTLELIDEACSDMSSRLYRKIREELGAAYMVGASRMLGLAGGCFYFYVATSPQQADEVEASLLDEIAFLGKNGLESAAFTAAKRAWAGGQMNHLQSLASRARVNVLDELYGFGWDHCEKTPAEMVAITEDQVRDVAHRHFVKQEGVIVRLLPKEK